MASIPQIRNRLLEGFPEKQADLLAHVVIEAHDDLVNQADFHALTGVVKELADAQKDLADAQKELTDAQKRTENTLTNVVKTQQKMLIRLDRLDGHMLEDKIAKNLPAFLGREFRKCRVLERAEFVEGLEGRLPEEELADLMRADVIATAKRAEQLVHLVVEASCTADADDLDRATRRTAALSKAGFTAIGIVACESISPQTLAAARGHGLRVLTNGWLLPEAA
ncbi:MAG: hypothetical protein WCR51_13700 [Planctomycetia bacterium]